MPPSLSQKALEIVNLLVHKKASNAPTNVEALHGWCMEVRVAWDVP